MNVLQSTWALKLKHFPDGLIKMLKTWFQARGDQQIKGIDFFETYASVVQWTSIWLMLDLEVLLELKSRQGDITAVFLNANLEEGENVLLEMPLCLRKKGKVYGSHQVPCVFWKHLVEKLEVCGMSQSKLNLCLFIGEKVMCICYVDDLLFWSQDEAHIKEQAILLHLCGIDLEQDDAAGFLVLRIEHNESSLLEMKQEGLLNCVIEALGLDDGTVNGKATPDEVKFLVKDKDGDVAHGDFSYNNIVGMMLYLSSHSRSDIAYAINCAACYMFCPRHSHELALQMI